MDLGLGLSMKMTSQGLLLSALTLTAAATFTACMKAPTTEINKGTQVSCSALDKAVDQLSVGQVSTIKKGEFAYREIIVQFDVLPPELMQQLGYTVMDKVDKTLSDGTTHYDEILLRREISEKGEGGQFKNSTKYFTLGFAKAQAAGGATAVQSILQNRIMNATRSRPISEKLGPLATPLGGADPENSFCAQATTTYHKLESVGSATAVPELVKKRADCGGLVNCTMPMRAISLKFDSWQNGTDGRPVKYTHYVSASPDAPYFAAMMSNCLQYSMPYQDRFLLVTQCSDVKDFKFGTSP
jgi:hypothetical protein